RMLRTNDPDRHYAELVSHWPTSEEMVAADRSTWPPLDDPVERMMYFDQVSYLPADLLVKLDRASMAVSLEAREPLLDYRLVEFAWTLPLSMKVRGGKGKRVLRRVLYRYVPEALIERPKMGFGIPLGGWLCGPLREWAESLLEPKSLRCVDAAAVRAAWEEHLRGKRDWKYHLWAVLMLQAWLREAGG